MDALKDYYDWIHRIRDALIEELKKEAGHEFICDGELIKGAENQSKVMMEMDRSEPYDTPKNPTVKETGDKKIVYYQHPEEKDSAIRKEIEKMAEDFLYLKEHVFLRRYSAIIGVGIAVKETPGQVILYATVRATTAEFMGVKIDS